MAQNQNQKAQNIAQVKERFARIAAQHSALEPMVKRAKTLIKEGVLTDSDVAFATAATQESMELGTQFTYTVLHNKYGGQSAQSLLMSTNADNALDVLAKVCELVVVDKPDVVFQYLDKVEATNKVTEDQLTALLAGKDKPALTGAQERPALVIGSNEENVETVRAFFKRIAQEGGINAPLKRRLEELQAAGAIKWSERQFVTDVVEKFQILSIQLHLAIREKGYGGKRAQELMLQAADPQANVKLCELIVQEAPELVFQFLQDLDNVNQAANAELTAKLAEYDAAQAAPKAPAPPPIELPRATANRYKQLATKTDIGLVATVAAAAVLTPAPTPEDKNAAIKAEVERNVREFHRLAADMTVDMRKIKKLSDGLYIQKTELNKAEALLDAHKPVMVRIGTEYNRKAKALLPPGTPTNIQGTEAQIVAQLVHAVDYAPDAALEYSRAMRESLAVPRQKAAELAEKAKGQAQKLDRIDNAIAIGRLSEASMATELDRFAAINDATRQISTLMRKAVDTTDSNKWDDIEVRLRGTPYFTEADDREMVKNNAAIKRKVDELLSTFSAKIMGRLPAKAKEIFKATTDKEIQVQIAGIYAPELALEFAKKFAAISLEQDELNKIPVGRALAREAAATQTPAAPPTPPATPDAEEAKPADASLLAEIEKNAREFYELSAVTTADLKQVRQFVTDGYLSNEENAKAENVTTDCIAEGQKLVNKYRPKIDAALPAPYVADETVGAPDSTINKLRYEALYAPQPVLAYSRELRASADQPREQAAALLQNAKDVQNRLAQIEGALRIAQTIPDTLQGSLDRIAQSNPVAKEVSEGMRVINGLTQTDEQVATETRLKRSGHLTEDDIRRRTALEKEYAKKAMALSTKFAADLIEHLPVKIKNVSAKLDTNENSAQASLHVEAASQLWALADPKKTLEYVRKRTALVAEYKQARDPIVTTALAREAAADARAAALPDNPEVLRLQAAESEARYAADQQIVDHYERLKNGGFLTEDDIRYVDGINTSMRERENALIETYRTNVLPLLSPKATELLDAKDEDEKFGFVSRFQPKGAIKYFADLYALTSGVQTRVDTIIAGGLAKEAEVNKAAEPPAPPEPPEPAAATGFQALMVDDSLGQQPSHSQAPAIVTDEQKLLREEAVAATIKRLCADDADYIATKALDKGLHYFECHVDPKKPGLPIELKFTAAPETDEPGKATALKHTIADYAGEFTQRGIPLTLESAVDIKMALQNRILNKKGIDPAYHTGAGEYNTIPLRAALPFNTYDAADRDVKVIERSGGMYALEIKVEDIYNTRQKTDPRFITISIPLGMASVEKNDAERAELNARKSLVLNYLDEQGRKSVFCSKEDIEHHLKQNTSSWTETQLLPVPGFDKERVFQSPEENRQKITLAPVKLSLDAGGDNPSWHMKLTFYEGTKDSKDMGTPIRSRSVNLHTRNPELALARAQESLLGVRSKGSAGSRLAYDFLPEIEAYMQAHPNAQWRMAARQPENGPAAQKVRDARNDAARGKRDNDDGKEVHLGDVPLQHFFDDMRRYEDDVCMRVVRREGDKIVLGVQRSNTGDFSGAVKTFTAEPVYESNEKERYPLEFTLTVPPEKEHQLITKINRGLSWYTGEKFSSISLSDGTPDDDGNIPEDKRKRPNEYRTATIRNAAIDCVKSACAELGCEAPSDWQRSVKKRARAGNDDTAQTHTQRAM